MICGTLAGSLGPRGSVARRRFLRATRGSLIAVALVATVCEDACLQLEGGGTGTLRVIVAGLSQAATSGGSVTVIRTDVATPPLIVLIPASGTDSVSVPAGTYKLGYSTPVGYVRALRTVNPQTTQVSAGQRATASFQVQVVTGFAPADLLDNASFETGWDRFTDWTLAPLPSPVSGVFSITRSRDVAYDGVWSAKSTFGPNSSDNSVHFVYPFGDQLDVYVRVYFYITGNVPDSHHKWIRFKTAGFGGTEGGLYLASITGGVTWADAANNSIDLDLGIGVPTFGVWHSIEVEYDRTGWDTPRGPRARFWYDGVAAVGPSPTHYFGNGGTAYWGDDTSTPTPAGPWLYAGAQAPILPPRRSSISTTRTTPATRPAACSTTTGLPSVRGALAPSKPWHIPTH